jgi:hypothetical protein
VHRPVVFHGTEYPDLVELSTRRRSRDASVYGDRTAVYATQDPVWALFYATLIRRPHLHAMRCGTLGVDASPLGRRYFFSVTVEPPADRLFRAGWMYVVPDDAFEHELPAGGLIDTAHRVHDGPVRPLARFPVRPDDFPLAHRVTRQRGTGSMLGTMLKTWRSGLRRTADTGRAARP